MSDLIDRQAILKNIEKIRQSVQMMDDTHRASIVMNGMYLCEKAVRNQPSVQPEQRWIPVSERLPRVNIEVLIQFEKNMVVGFYGKGWWHVNTGNDFYTSILPSEDQPIAWMPLPEPYKPEREVDG